MERWATKPVHQGRARTAATPLHWRVRWATRAAVSRTGGPVPVPALEWRGAGRAPESRCRVQHGSVAGAWAHSPCRRGDLPVQRPDTGRMPTPFLATPDPVRISCSLTRISLFGRPTSGTRELDDLQVSTRHPRKMSGSG